MRAHFDELLERFGDDALEEAMAALKEPRRKERYDKTADEVFDESTLKAFQRLISLGVINTLDYPVKTGKEGNVFHATNSAGIEVAVKVFRVHTSTFRNHLEYIIGDPRFQDVKPSKREVIHAWARKEFRNLSEMMDVGIDVPTPLHVERNVLVMEWVGTDGAPAPMLKDVRVDDAQATYDRTLDIYERMVDEAGLVHGDFSEFNILIDDDRLVVMDMGQAVQLAHPRARELMERDAKNICRYFRKIGADAEADAFLDRVEPSEEE